MVELLVGLKAISGGGYDSNGEYRGGRPRSTPRPPIEKNPEDPDPR